MATALSGAAAGATPEISTTSNTDVVDAKKPTLESIALSPLTFAAMPGTTQQLTVTGTFRDGQSAALNASKQTFTSSNPAIATVSAEGVVIVTAGALVGGTSTIGVTNIKTGISASSG
jgi:trimeric autotransporter adhesin